MVIFPPGGLFPCMSIRPILTDELLQFSFSYEGLDLLFQIIAIRNVVTVITVETAILVPRSLSWIARLDRSSASLGTSEIPRL